MPPGDRIVWRGVPCANWHIESSLKRALRTHPDYYEAVRVDNGPNDLRQAERSLIALARSWGIGANNVAPEAKSRPPRAKGAGTSRVSSGERRSPGSVAQSPIEGSS